MRGIIIACLIVYSNIVNAGKLYLFVGKKKRSFIRQIGMTFKRYSSVKYFIQRFKKDYIVLFNSKTGYIVSAYFIFTNLKNLSPSA